MSPSKREREYARRRYEKWAAHERELASRRRRRNTIAGIVCGVLVLGLVIYGVIVTVRPSTTPATADTETDLPTATSTAEQSAAGESSFTAGEGPDGGTATAEVTDSGTISTSFGDMTIGLYGKAAPKATEHFKGLVDKKFYDNLTCHRLTGMTNFWVLQCGDPNGDGTGGSGTSFGPIENAPSDDEYPAGALAMARSGGNADSMDSQFFIVYNDTQIPSDSAGGYTVFGVVTSGLDNLRTMAQSGVQDGGVDGAPVVPVTIKGVSLE